MRALVLPDVDQVDVELLADALFRIGAAAVEERGNDGGCDLWTHVGDTDADIERAVRALPPGTVWRVVDVDDAAGQQWRQFATATWLAGDVVIVPSWQPDVLAKPGTLVVPIDPGAAFGLGDHPTTRLTAEALVRRASGGPLGAVLDVGCGSGVLAVLAALLGADSVVAIDIAAAAIEATTDNARRNRVGDRIDVSLRSLDELDTSFDLVLANLLAPTIIELRDGLVAAVGDRGRLVVSGILAGDEQRIGEALTPLRRSAMTELDGWAAVEFER